MICEAHLYLIIGGVIWGLFFFFSRNLFLGVSFLMVCLALAGFFVAYLGVLYTPWQTSWILSAVKGLRIFTMVVFFVVLVSFIIIQVQIWKGSKTRPLEDTECLIVLGAGVYGTRPSASLRLRMDVALEYLQANPEVKAILSGGQGEGKDISEAEAMRRYMTERGISANRLILEDKSTSTIENLTFSFQLADFHGYSKLTVVSNEFHLYRANRLAEALGYTVGVIAAPVPKQGLFPLSYYLREYCSVLLMYIREII